MTLAERRRRRFLLEGSPRERKLRDFRSCRSSGRDRDIVTETHARKASRPIKRMLSREARRSLKRAAQATAFDDGHVVDCRALRNRFDHEIC